jgi:hypothetical protein
MTAWSIFNDTLIAASLHRQTWQARPMATIPVDSSRLVWEAIDQGVLFGDVPLSILNSCAARRPGADQESQSG